MNRMTDTRSDGLHDCLSVENAAILLIDRQEGYFGAIKAIDTGELGDNLIARCPDGVTALYACIGKAVEG